MYTFILELITIIAIMGLLGMAIGKILSVVLKWALEEEQTNFKE